MKLWKSRRQKRYKGESIVKYIYLSEGDVAYRLTRGLLDEITFQEKLSRYYVELSVLYDNRAAAFRLYLIVLAVSALAQYGVITEVSAAGVTISLSSIQHVVLMAFGISLCNLGAVTAKYDHIRSIFQGYYNSREAEEKADLLARFPKAFLFYQYYTNLIGNPRYLIRLQLPLQLIGFLTAFLLGFVLYTAFSMYIFFVTAIEVWQAPATEFGGWSKTIAVVSTLIALTAFLMPSSAFWKRRYTHTGLIELVNKFSNHRKNRWPHFARKISDAETRMGLNAE